MLMKLNTIIKDHTNVSVMNKLMLMEKRRQVLESMTHLITHTTLLKDKLIKLQSVSNMVLTTISTML
jgi:hypothetical protein